MFAVVGTATYLHEISKWPKPYQEAAAKYPQKLAGKPSLGDPLGFPFLREKRIREKRIYYLVYEDLRLVLLVATSGKKDQQRTIDYIKQQLGEFKSEAEKIARQAV